MNEWIFVISLIILCASLIIQFRNKKRGKELITISQLLVNKSNELNETAKWLNYHTNRLVKQRNINHEEETKLLQERLTLTDIEKKNYILIDEAKKLLKSNKHQVFYVKESAVLLYNHYHRISEMLDGLIENEEELEYEEIFSVLNTANHNMNFLKGYFQQYFRMTPEEYSQQKVNLGGRAEDGTEFISNSSIN